MDATIELVKKIEETGIAAIAVHCRYTWERPREPSHWDVLSRIAESIKIPLIANGDVFNGESLKKMKEIPGVSSVMVARGAQYNPSIFKYVKSETSELEDLHEVSLKLIELARLYDHHFGNTKYILTQMWIHERDQTHKYKSLVQRLIESSDYDSALEIISNRNFD